MTKIGWDDVAIGFIVPAAVIAAWQTPPARAG